MSNFVICTYKFFQSYWHNAHLLVPIYDSLSADLIALSDRPWLLQTARHGLAYMSISFQLATHVTPYVLLIA